MQNLDFTLFPAIDLREGRVVRLEQGQDTARTQYGDDPVAFARSHVEAGATALHVVDLDAAFGDGDHAAVIAEIVAAVEVPVQVGGGLRDDDAVARVLDAGAARAIIGSAAVERPDWVGGLVSRFGGDRVVVGIDARDGVVKTRGWVEDGGVSAVQLAEDMAERGVRRTIVTNIARDGTGQGPDVDLCAEVARASGLQVVVSGGVGALEHVREASRRRGEGLVGIVIGKALFDGRFDLSAAQEAADAEA